MGWLRCSGIMISYLSLRGHILYRYFIDYQKHNSEEFFMKDTEQKVIAVPSWAANEGNTSAKCELSDASVTRQEFTPFMIG